MATVDHATPDHEPTSGVPSTLPPLDVGAVRRARAEVDGGDEHDPTALHGTLAGQLGAYDNLAARYAYLVAETTAPSDGMVKQDAHSDRLLLGEIRDLHYPIPVDGSTSPSERACAQCGVAYPCKTRALIEGVW